MSDWKFKVVPVERNEAGQRQWKITLTQNENGFNTKMYERGIPIEETLRLALIHGTR